MVLGALGALAVWLLPSWFPVAAAVQADRQDTLYFWLMVMSSFIFALVIVFLVYMMVNTLFVAVWVMTGSTSRRAIGAPVRPDAG